MFYNLLNRNVLSAYAALFPEFFKDARETVPIKGIEEVELSLDSPLIDDVARMGALLGQLLDRDNLEWGLERTAVGEVFRSLAPDGALDEFEAASYFNYFSYDPSANLIQEPDMASLGDCGKEEQVCPAAKDQRLCAQYCNITGRVARNDAVIRDVFEMAVHPVNDLGSRSKSMLPNCNWAGDECWTKVITERGVCFTNYDSGTKTQANLEFIL